MQIIRGALATAVGVSANVPVDVGQLPEDLPLDIVKKSVDELIAKAVARAAGSGGEPLPRARRPEPDPLGRGRGTAQALGSTRAAIGPSTRRPTRRIRSRRTTPALISLRIPVFTGFDIDYRTQKAKEEAEAAKASAERTEDHVILDVWSSYYAVQTSTQRIATTPRPARERAAVGRRRGGPLQGRASGRSSIS